jgi:hypothetical protein
VADEFEKYLAQDEEDEFSKYEEKELPVGNTTPYTPNPRPIMMRGGPMTDIGPKGPEIKQYPLSEDEAAAAKSGVNIDTRLPTLESIKSGFAANPAERDAFISSYISSRYGPEAVTRTGPDSGQLEFYNPESGHWEFAEPNAYSALPHLPEMITSTAGAVGGGLAGSAGGPVGTALGSATGAGLGQALGSYGRMKVGQAFGLNESMADTSIASTAGEEGAVTGAIDLGVSAGYGAYRGIKAIIFGKQVLTPQEAGELYNAQRRADKTIRDVNAAVPSVAGDLYKPWTAQVAPDTAGGRKLLQASYQLTGDPNVGPKMAQDVFRNENALSAYMDNTVLPSRMGLDAPYEGALPLKDAVSAEKGTFNDPLVAQGAQATDNYNAAMSSMAPANAASAGRGVRQGLADKYMAARKAKNDAYAKYQDEAGYDPKTRKSVHEVPASNELRQYQKALKAQIKRIPLKAVGQEKKSLLLKLSEDKTINLADLDETLKWLRAGQRRSRQGKLTIPFSEMEASRLEGVLSTMRDNYLDNYAPEARAALQEAEQAAYVEGNTFKYGLTKNLLKKEGGEYSLTDAKVITTILRNKDPAAAREIADVLGSDPNAKVAAQNYLFAIYRKKVGQGSDKPLSLYQKHKAFMDDYGPVIDEFFDPAQQQKIRELGGFAETISANMKNLDELNSIWNKSYKGRIDRMSAEALVDRVFTKSFTTKDVTNIKNIAGRYSPEVLDHWKAGIADKLRERMFKEGLVDSNGLSRLMGDHDALAKLNIIFGPRFVRSLDTLKSASDIVRRMPPDINLPSKNTVWTDLLRAFVFPPLSSGGRRITLFQNTRGRSYANKIYRALSDPSELERMATRITRTRDMMIGLNVGATATKEMQHDD